jgi:ArsR family transcriptional regulator, arsenate/arsenite/antimonite-responsive transcriptional repressor
MTDLPVINCCTPLAGSSLGERQAGELELVMKALADRNRLRIVNMLLRADGEPVCVCEFEPFLGLAQGGLVERESRGTRSYFALVPGALDSVREVFAPAAACC